MKTIAPEKALGQLARHAEQIRSGEPCDLSTMEPGDWFAQGDVRIDRLPDGWAERNSGSLDRVARPARQLAPGDTPGSRHALDSLAGVTVYRVRGGNVLDGPVLVTTEGRSIEHPEHGDLTNLPPGTYAVTYQRAYAEELRRVQD